MVRALAPTEVPKALATSLAPEEKRRRDGEKEKVNYILSTRHSAASWWSGGWLWSFIKRIFNSPIPHATKRARKIEHTKSHV
jgi:hypothetical protein